MQYFSDIPNHPIKQTVNEMPFDIEAYISSNYNKAKLSWSKKYNPQHLEKKLTKYREKLGNDKNKYFKWFNSFIEQLKKDIEEKNRECVIQVPVYGPDVYYDSIESTMIDCAVKNLYFILSSKGYSFRESEINKSIIDFMAGHCLICKREIRICLQ
jgi:hypothetical protein